MPKRKVILHGSEARAKLKEGVDLVANTIKETLGPKGRNVIVRNLGPLPPRSMNDGYYIADHIMHDDPIINAGADMVKEICKKTNDVAGDGTTTTSVLAQNLIENGLKMVEEGINPVDIKRRLNKDLSSLKDELKSLSKPIKTADDVKYIATISGNNDEEIGEAMKEIYEKVGKNASIEVEKSAESKIRVETTKGIKFHKGFDEARDFVNNPRMMTSEYKDCHVLCVDDKLEYIDDINPFLEHYLGYMNENGRGGWESRLLIIVNEIDRNSDAMTYLLANNIAAKYKKASPDGRQQGCNLVVVEAPEFGPTRSEIMEDIAVATGGICINKMSGLKLSEITGESLEKVLGKAEKVVVSTNTTTIIGGQADKKKLAEYIDKLKGETGQLHTNAKITREKYEKRLQTISAGVAIIHAGGATEVESKERHLRLEDAVLAVRAAIEEGSSVGGGHTYYQLSKRTDNELLREACLSVSKQVIKNAGENPKALMDKFTDRDGYNALTGKIEDLEKSGVMDSTKVIRVALENAVSLASLFLTTSSTIVEDVVEVEEKKYGLQKR